MLKAKETIVIAFIIFSPTCCCLLYIVYYGDPKAAKSKVKQLSTFRRIITINRIELRLSYMLERSSSALKFLNTFFTERYIMPLISSAINSNESSYWNFFQFAME
ncbi:hypothetical protein GQX74_006332 [Glossina fuscipes]|nr:hypothetical protein GQX74_006332 [Glossina fuscipes]